MKLPSAIILAAGHGKRMRSSTPKMLQRICGREMLGIVSDTVIQLGLNPVIAVLPPTTAPFRGALPDGVSYVVQKQAMGTGHAVLQAREQLASTDSVVILCGDVPLIKPETIRSLIKHHEYTNATLTILTSTKTNPAGLGRIVRSENGSINSIIEEQSADQHTLNIRETNSGVYCFDAQWLWESLPRLVPSITGELFLTDLVETAVSQKFHVESIQTSNPHETQGVNTHIELARVEGILRQRIRERWMMSGVKMPDPNSVYIDLGATIDTDVSIYPNTHIRGITTIGRGCAIGPNTIIDDSQIGMNCQINSSVVEQAELNNSVIVGPFSHLRRGTRLESNVYIGNYSEVKNSNIGNGSKSGHFSYIGDANIGSNVNIGAGSITCNYDGTGKNLTSIGHDAFIGCDTMLVAPVEIGAHARTGVGSIITKDVPDGASAIGAPARIVSKSKEQQKLE